MRQLNKNKTTEIINNIKQNFQPKIAEFSCIGSKIEEVNGSEYVIQLLNYYRLGIVMNAIGMNREVTEGDVRFFSDNREVTDDEVSFFIDNIEERLKADVMISFWTPYSRSVRNLKPYRKNQKKIYSKNYVHISEMIKQKDRGDIASLNVEFAFLAEHYFSRGNLLILKERAMNNLRYSLYEDRLDSTLYNCFSGGKLAKFFNNDAEVVQWIRQEKLECMFKDSQPIIRDNIKSLISDTSMKDEFSFADINEEQVLEYLDNCMKIIEARNNEFETDRASYTVKNTGEMV